MKTYFTADLHFGHANVIKYNSRPFNSVEEHDRALVDNWNSVVTNKDRVYFLGDLAFHPSSAAKWVEKLNGLKYWIRGNHDNPSVLSNLRQYFQWVREMEEICILDNDAPHGKRYITLNHYAMRVWNKSHYGAWHLYGHSHGLLPDDPKSLSFDVGVDCHDYTPISYDRVKEIMSLKTWTSPLEKQNT
jgi:calcineurin-like phosphoesterase family protein